MLRPRKFLFFFVQLLVNFELDYPNLKLLVIMIKKYFITCYFIISF